LSEEKKKWKRVLERAVPFIGLAVELSKYPLVPTSTKYLSIAEQSERE